MFDKLLMKYWKCLTIFFILLTMCCLLLILPYIQRVNLYNRQLQFVGTEYVLPVSKVSAARSQRMQTLDKWIILLTLNDGYFDMFKNWWRHFRRLDMNVTVTIVAEDQTIFEKLQEQFNYDDVRIVRSWLLNISEPLRYGSRKYKQMMSARPTYIHKYLKEGLNILYSDIDTVWLQNLFPYLTGSYDMWFQYEKNRMIAGFMAIISKSENIKLMKLWKHKLGEKLQTNQLALNELIRNDTANVSVAYFSEHLFVGGSEFSRMSRKQRANAVMVHATHCTGFIEKRSCLKKWKLW